MFIGEVGDFWAGVLLRRADKPTSSRLLHNILTPLPRTWVAALLAERQVLSSCIDNSDGLWPSLQQLSEASGVNLRVDLDGLQFGEDVKNASRELGLDPRRFALGWGDWNLVGTCGEADIQRFMDTCSETETPAQVVGEVSNGRGVNATYNGVLGVMTEFDSERFAADSWFSAGLTSYIDRLLNEPILSQL